MGPSRNRFSSGKIVKKPIFAVVIGINRYGSSSYPNLCGAAEDADRFNNYLTHGLGVPCDNIYSLRNEDASRAGIIQAIRWLKGHAKIRKDEAVIIIYFAGHGVRTNKKMQMICPSDIGTEIPSKNGRAKLVEGISGATLAKHFKDLSRAKGDNITIFLDCCHSTGMLHPKTTIRRRLGTQNKPDIFTTSSVFVEDRELYTVITACGSRRQAFEDDSMKSGFFTSRLLEVLNSQHSGHLTYISLMHQLGGMPDEQIAHCEGSRLHRPLFNFDPALAGDPSLVLTRCLPNGSVLLYAGSAQGVVKGDELDIYANNLSDPRVNPSLGKLVVVSVAEFSSFLFCDSVLASPHTLPPLFYCKLVDSSAGKSTVLFSSDKKWLQSIFPPDIQSRLSLNLADEGQRYDLQLDVLDQQVHFQQSTELITAFVDPCMRETVSKNDTDRIHKIVKRFIHFYSNLSRSSAHNLGDIDIELNELSRTGEEVFTLSNPRILVEDQIRIPASDTKVYGLTVRNRSAASLYPYLFCFDPMDLTIRSLYQPPTAAGEHGLTSKTDSPLLPSTELTIGYGSNVLHGKHFSFCLRGEEQSAIAHLRLYLSSCPASFESMIRETSPFVVAHERAIITGESEDDRLLRGRWMAKTTTFILEH